MNLDRNSDGGMTRNTNSYGSHTFDRISRGSGAFTGNINGLVGGNIGGAKSNSAKMGTN